jgi:hypothetical protein
LFRYETWNGKAEGYLFWPQLGTCTTVNLTFLLHDWKKQFGIDFGDTNKFSQVENFTNTESINNEDQLYSIHYICMYTFAFCKHIMMQWILTDAYTWPHGPVADVWSMQRT